MLRSLVRSERDVDPLAEKEQQILWERSIPSLTSASTDP